MPLAPLVEGPRFLTGIFKDEAHDAPFFLGLAYKQAMKYGEAAEHLRNAVHLPLRIKEALAGLIEVLYLQGRPETLEEAQEWTQVAEEVGVFPAKVTFLKGLILQKEGRYGEAREAFGKANSLS